MEIKTFQDLRVWQYGHQLVLKIYKITKSFPDQEKFGLSTQIRRSSASICANICEGFKKNRKEFLRYLHISQASLEETKYHLILSKDLLYFSEVEFGELMDLSETVGRMLNGLIKSFQE